MIPIALTFLLAAPDAKDKTINDLAKAVSTITKRSAIAVLPTFDKVSLPEDPKIVDDIVSPLRKQGFSSLVSDVAVVYQAGIPRSHWGVLRGLIQKDAKSDATFKPVAIPQSAIKDNLITFETKDTEAVKLGSLMSLDFPRRIMVSPYFNSDNSGDYPIAISAKDMAYGDFVKALTRGLGGKLAVDSKTYTIGFDGASFRTNAGKLLALAQEGVNEGRMPSGVTAQFNGGSYSEYQEYQDASQPPMATSKPALTAALTLLGQTIGQMSDQLLEQTFAYKGTSTRLSLTTFTNLQVPAVNYLRAVSAGAAPQTGATVQRRGPGGGMDLTNIIRRVDPQNPGRLIITTDFRVSLELNLATQPRRGRNGANPPVTADSGNSITIQVL